VERSEFERLAMEQLDALHRAAFHLSRDSALAADLVQETYLRALRSAHQFEDRGGGVRPWLFTILHNVFYTHLHRESRQPTGVEEIYSPDDSALIPGDPPPAWDLESMDWEHVDDRIKEAIDLLSPDLRITLLLWGVEGMKYREIAEVFDVPIGTVMSRLFRARQQLSKRLADLPAELGVKINGPTDDKP